MLKLQLLGVLAALGTVGGPIFRAIVVLVSAAVNKFVPDNVQGVTTMVGAAPDVIRSTITDLFHKAVAYIPSGFMQRMVNNLLDTVVASYLDQAWDAVFKPALVGSAKPEPEDSDLFAKCCE